jgi:hypothetical protein
LIGEIREACGRMRSSTSVGRFWKTEEAMPNTMNRMKAGATSAALAQPSRPNSASTSGPVSIFH